MSDRNWQDLHSSAVVIDMHSDIPADVVRLRGLGQAPGVFERVHGTSWREGGMDGAVVTVGGDQLRTPSPYEYACRTIELMREEEQAGALQIVTESRQLLSGEPSHRARMVLSCEGASPIEGSVEKLNTLYGHGLRFMGLTWSAKNEIGVGVGAGDGGLTDLGRSVVQAMADLGMVTDLSHASATTFWDCIGLQTGNVVATHSNAAALKSHPRNLTDDQLKALGEQGGVVGACALPDFLPGDAPGLSELVDQIAYIGELIGIEHVGIGFDLFDYLPEAEARARLALSATSSGPDRDPYPNYIKGLEGVRRTSALTTLLVERGFAAGDIRGVLGGNIARAWQAVEARSGKARAAGA